jgi:hypothetical protein
MIVLRPWPLLSAGRIGLVLFLTIFTMLPMAIGGCSSGPEAPLSTAEAASASRVYFAPAEKVLKAVDVVLFNYGFVVEPTETTQPGAWRIRVKPNAANNFKEVLEQVVLEANGPKQCRMYLIVTDTSWFGGPSEPDWASGFFTSVSELVMRTEE